MAWAAQRSYKVDVQANENHFYISLSANRGRSMKEQNETIFVYAYYIMSILTFNSHASVPLSSFPL